jgi:hypothetical protein
VTTDGGLVCEIPILMTTGDLGHSDPYRSVRTDFDFVDDVAETGGSSTWRTTNVLPLQVTSLRGPSAAIAPVGHRRACSINRNALIKPVQEPGGAGSFVEELAPEASSYVNRGDISVDRKMHPCRR